jgi:cysteinyl-tRNA synthetase
MSMKLLGETLDIHGGGLDLQFPHHENELAQSESFTGKPFANYWMHNGLLKLGDSKMAGSVGNVVNVADLLARHSPETVRMLLLSTHYRSPIEFPPLNAPQPEPEDEPDRLEVIKRSLESFYRLFERYQRITREDFYTIEAPRRSGPFEVPTANEFLAEVARLRAQFLESMDDDFNTGGAVGKLYELLTHLNRFADSRKLEAPGAPADDIAQFKRGMTVLRELAQVLGLFETKPAASAAASDELVSGLIQLLIDLRQEARKSKNFPLSDQIRKRLGELGVTLEDRPGGTGWRVGG